MRKIAFLIAIVLSVSIFTSCSSRVNESVSPETAASSEPSESIPISSEAALTNDVREITVPSELVGSPDRIYIVVEKQEKIFEAGTDDYNKIMDIVKGRFPEKLKEAAKAILWSDGTAFDWSLVAEETNYLRLTYDTAQTIKLNCTDNNDLPVEELIFNDLVFPLEDGHTGLMIFDTGKTSDFVGKSFGPLENSSEVIAKLEEFAK